jgi:electron transport complex protein RnfD
MSLPIVNAVLARSDSQVQAIMKMVMVALTPATLWGLFIFGWPALFLLIVTMASALVFEALCLNLCGRPVRATLLDGSALLSGWLIAMTLPPWAPWWIGVTGSFIAIVVGKQVFGGLGQNIFNPAMLARVALLVSFPLEMTTWIPPSLPFSSSAPTLAESMAITFGGAALPDGTTGATLIGLIKTEFSQGHSLSAALETGQYGFFTSFLGWTSGSLGETSSLLLLCGGFWLMKKKVITWHIPASMVITVMVLAGFFALIDSERYPGPLFHLTSGALVLCAFFIATDYVTSPSNPVGQILFGAGCGLLVFVIRTWGAYPEGAGFAVLLMNSATPVIDHYIRPRIYGRDHKGRPLDLPGGGE